MFYISALGAAYGTAKSGTGIAAMSVMRPELIMKSIIPVVMAGIIAIYGLVVAVLIAGSLESPSGGYTLYRCVLCFLIINTCSSHSTANLTNFFATINRQYINN